MTMQTVIKIQHLVSDEQCCEIVRNLRCPDILVFLNISTTTSVRDISFTTL